MDSFAEWQDEWGLVLTHERRVAELSRTVPRHIPPSGKTVPGLGTTHPEIDSPEKVTARHVGAFLTAMADAGVSENTRRIRLKSLRLWFGYLATQPDSGVTRNPAWEVDLPEEKLPPVPVIPDEDLLTLLRSMGGTSFVDRRDTAIVRLLLDCGMRRGELVGIDAEDVDLHHSEITLHRTKGGKARIVPFGGKTALAVRRYLRTRDRQSAAGSPALFMSIRSDRAGQWCMTGGGVAEMLTRRCTATELTHLRAHQLRHTWANGLLSHGANEGDVERLAGWSSPLMVRRYRRSAADQRARESARGLAPGDRV